MKKIIFMLAAVTFFGMSAKAQDIITLKNGDEIKAKVQEIGISEVKYKKYDNLTGPVYTLLKAEIFMIKYENGKKDVFKDEPAAAAVSTENKPEEGLAPTKSQNMALGLFTGQKPKASLEIANTKFENAYGEKLSAQEVRSVLAGMPNALELYESGRRMRTTGWVFLGVGAGCIVVGGSMMDIDNAASFKKATPLYVVGLGCCIAAIIFEVKGNAKWKSAYNLYQGSKSGKSTSLNFGDTRSGGIGFTYNF
ncbi:MAG: hypothetical protein LBK18_00615 [Prevotellaceae bacterium]|jgi:hypothetical protein|nr:hypothetical protein [Prevotellaceae bacterium]